MIVKRASSALMSSMMRLGNFDGRLGTAATPPAASLSTEEAGSVRLAGIVMLRPFKSTGPTSTESDQSEARSTSALASANWITGERSNSFRRFSERSRIRMWTLPPRPRFSNACKGDSADTEIEMSRKLTRLAKRFWR